MSLEFRTGDLLHANAEALVNAVNCVGIMGRGIALQFKNAFPANFELYAAACVRRDVRPGRVFVFETGLLHNPKYIVNFPTKRHWRDMSRLEDIASGLQALAAEVLQRNIRSIAMPRLGCGLGGLDWDDVRRLIEPALGSLGGLHVIIFDRWATTPDAQPVRAQRDDVPISRDARST